MTTPEILGDLSPVSDRWLARYLQAELQFDLDRSRGKAFAGGGQHSPMPRDRRRHAAAHQSRIRRRDSDWD